MEKVFRGLSPEKIINEAARLFYEQGYKNTSLEEVADRLNVTRPAIYHYFKSKESIMLAIQDRVIDKVQRYSSEIWALNLPSDQKFQKMVYHHALLILGNKIEMGIVFEELKNLPKTIAEEAVTIIDEYYRRMTSLYRESVKAGCFMSVNPSIAVHTILGACNWAYKWFSPQGSYTIEETAQIISDLLVEGYRKHPNPKSAETE